MNCFPCLLVGFAPISFYLIGLLLPQLLFSPSPQLIEPEKEPEKIYLLWEEKRKIKDEFAKQKINSDFPQRATSWKDGDLQHLIEALSLFLSLIFRKNKVDVNSWRL